MKVACLNLVLVKIFLDNNDKRRILTYLLILIVNSLTISIEEMPNNINSVDSTTLDLDSVDSPTFATLCMLSLLLRCRALLQKQMDEVTFGVQVLFIVNEAKIYG